jgi:ribosomal-protein-alanine N-acetyltransferase
MFLSSPLAVHPGPDSEYVRHRRRRRTKIEKLKKAARPDLDDVQSADNGPMVNRVPRGMPVVLIPPHSLNTDRLLLRPTNVADADRGFEIQTDWEVARMLSLASFPPDRQEIEGWFADHPRQWEAGHAYRFAVVLNGKMVGLVDIDGIGEREGSLGYWLDRAVWGHGYAFEAAQAVTRFAIEDVGLVKLKAGHAHDNPASGRILTKLGFNRLDIVERFSRPRNEYISQCRYIKLSG